ncbi:nucleolin [Quercus lobata]|uniref:Uncharacterized protein n=1 Tax=Quercus lobata TaxID=97700 RepID=A0A7N2QWX0_QUELO|nr:nucleolin [Quercus lobata]
MKKAQSEAKEVEELLQAAQDELLLKLSLDSHMSRVSPNYIDSDLDRRFQALKKSRPSSSSVVPQSQSHKSTDNNSNNSDLSARFAALKAKGSSPSSSSAAVGVGAGPSSNILYEEEEEEDDEDDEVEKLIRWAKDAARLDPSPPSDDDDDDQDEEDDDEEDYKKDCHEKPKGNHPRRK